MSIPNQYYAIFDLTAEFQSTKPFSVFVVKDKSRENRDSLLRLLPKNLSVNKETVDIFLDFFTRFSEIINRAYIPIVYSVSGHPETGVYVLEEYFSGIHLKSFIEKNHQNPDFDEQLVTILGKVCEALHHAHQRDIYHLCITPEDILIDEDTGKVKLVGFGVQIFSDIKQMDLLSEAAKKTIAPEILSGSKPRPSADVYSLARAMLDSCPGVFEQYDLFRKALSAKPYERYQSVRDLEVAIKASLRTKASSSEPSAIFDRPLKSGGGLKPVLGQQGSTVEIAESEDDTYQNAKATRSADQPHEKGPSFFRIVQIGESFSVKFLVLVIGALLVLAIGFGAYTYYRNLVLEKETAIADQKKAELLAAFEKAQREKDVEIARLQEIQRQAQAEKERLAALEQEKLKNENLRRELEALRQKEAERSALIQQQKRDRESEAQKSSSQSYSSPPLHRKDAPASDISIKSIYVWGREFKLGPVKFSHARHFKIHCKSCHHDSKIDRTYVWGKGDRMKRCGECHMVTANGNVPKLEKAFHDLCIVCHRKNRANDQVTGPIACFRCHDKKTPF